MYALRVKNLTKEFGKGSNRVRAVDNISFSVKKGEIFGLLGVNGAGKSTTLSMLSGLLLPDKGEIEILGKSLKDHDEELKGRFNLATAYYSLSHTISVLQNLRVYAKLYEIKNPEAKIKELSEKFMIDHLFDVAVKKLSSGERTRVVLVKSLLNDPEVLFLDECTVGLDPDMAEVTRQMLLEHNKRTGCTIIFTSHYMKEVERLCNRIAFMNKGKIVKVGDAKSLVGELATQRVDLEIAKGITKVKTILTNRDISFEQKQSHFTFHIENKKRAVYDLLDELVSAGVIFDDLHLAKPTLEDYFLAQSRSAR